MLQSRPAVTGQTIPGRYMMRGVVDRSRRSPWRVVGSVIIALGCFLLLSRFLPSMLPIESEDTGASHTPRRHVVIFLVDTTDYFDAHGAYVHSVILQHCPRCEVQL